MADATLQFDLRTPPKKINVIDSLDYDSIGWDINEVTIVISFSGPAGSVYSNTDHMKPDIVPAASRELNKTIPLPLDPQEDYKNVLKGSYTLKVEWKENNLNQIRELLQTFSYEFDPPTIKNETTGGPYTGKLTSKDVTDYGNYSYSLVREHRIKYPIQLSPSQPDIVSTEDEVEVTPIYTNNWTIQITSEATYTMSDGLIILWKDSGTFTHCVYGACISSMMSAIEQMLKKYYDDVSCNVSNQEAWQKRLVIVNTSWHLLQEAYFNNKPEEADKQAAIIQKEIEYAGINTCGGNTSTLVEPCPPWGGSGSEYSYYNENPTKKTVGGIEQGETFFYPAKTLDEIFHQMFYPTTYPTFVDPSSSFVFVTNVGSYREIGEVLDITVRASFNRGQIVLDGSFQNYRAGEVQAYTYTGTGIAGSYNSNLNTDERTANDVEVVQGVMSWTSQIHYAEGPQPLDSDGNNYGSPLPAGDTSVITRSFEGVYPLFATSVDINTLTKQSLVSMLHGNYIVIDLVPETGGEKQKFEIPEVWLDSRPLTNVQTYNTLSGQWENTGLSQWDVSDVTEVVQGHTIPYKRYTYNGSDRSDIRIRLIF